MNDPTKPVPTPFSVRWRSWRTRLLPGGVFAVCTATVAALWGGTVVAPSLLAEAELVRSEIRSAQSGTLVSLHVRLLEPVVAGQTIALVHVHDPRTASAELELVRAELEATRVSMEPLLDLRRAATDRARLALEWMEARVSLAGVRADSLQASSDFERMEQLRSRNLVATEDFERARTRRDSLRAQLEAQEALVETLAPREIEQPDEDRVLSAALEVHDRRLRLIEAATTPVPLRAAHDGVVSTITRQAGETVQAGEAIAAITAPRVARLVGYVRQPLDRPPAPGSSVKIRTRRVSRTIGRGIVTETGVALEVVSPTLLAALGRSDTPELGLRIHIAPSPGLDLFPGEQVDVVVLD
ncbi:hypothetical protein ASA1KI_43650 [Opitutales bacterium ASA1]|uniref:HlyD family secretion protein n=1 Tax=Congregicoccus parvus TaxID=3081749 RepID=UPI002B2D7499|nr:hypothetical protein ASA1KI_43650 [Opitutales bacterium ASA1]